MTAQAGAQTAPPAPSAGTPTSWLPALAVTAACALVYANALSNGFVFDDIHLVKDNDAIRSAAYIREIFTDNLWGLLGRASNYYRPLPPLMYMGTYALFGLVPWAFHLLNVVLHAGASVLVYLIALRLLGRPDPGGPPVVGPALLAALLFAVHPIHTEAVTWIAGIMDVSCTFFALLSFYCFLRVGDTRLLGAPYVLSLASFFLATLCKEPALLLPLVIFAYDYLRRGRSERSLGRAVTRTIPYVAVVGLYLALRSHALKGMVPVTRGGTDIGAYETWINIPPLFELYLRKLAIPLYQNVLYHVPPVTSLLEPRAFLGLVVVAAFVAAAIAAARRSSAVFLSLAFLALPLAPALYLPALTQKPVNAFAERYAYFASVGLVLLAGAALLQVRSRRPRAYGVAVAAVAVVIVVFAVLTVERNTVWKDNLALWSDSVAKSPQSAIAHENLGYALFYAGRRDEGARELQTALRLDSDIPRRVVATGIQYSRKGLFKEAILEFSIALMFDPNMVDAHYNLGLALQEKGWLDAAIEHYQRALALAPRFEEAHVNLGIAHAEKGDLDKAIDHFRAAVELEPTDREARHNLARAYAAKGLLSLAEEQRRIAATLDDPERARPVAPR
ncbi:MAG: tetratricopeptide repeat protein [Vicinamibacteria bacterium]